MPITNSPIVPRSVINPIGGTERINKSINVLNESLDAIESWLLSRFKEIPVNTIVVNSWFFNKYRYEYQISIPDLERLVQEMYLQLDTVPDDYLVQQTLGAYSQSTELAVINLSNITDDYTRNITQVLLSEPYQRRAALVGARVFEEMNGFEGDTGVQLARVLRQAVQDGVNPLDVSKEISKRFDVAQSRAETIARTEITGALRRGRWDEAQDANDRLGIKTMLLWVSALSPTTRWWHAVRHAGLYTIQAVRDFYAEGGNAINCKCGQVEQLVDDDGKPINTRAIDRLKKQKKEYFGDE